MIGRALRVSRGEVEGQDSDGWKKSKRSLGDKGEKMEAEGNKES